MHGRSIQEDHHHPERGDRYADEQSRRQAEKAGDQDENKPEERHARNADDDVPGRGRILPRSLDLGTKPLNLRLKSLCFRRHH